MEATGMKKIGKWWDGVRCRCRKCGEYFELEEVDVPIMGGHKESEPPYFYNVRCPDCGEWVAVEKPWNA